MKTLILTIGICILFYSCQTAPCSNVISNDNKNWEFDPTTQHIHTWILIARPGLGKLQVCTKCGILRLPDKSEIPSIKIWGQ
jgi:hypothetical protein